MPRSWLTAKYKDSKEWVWKQVSRSFSGRKKRILALDVGEKRIGLAVSDPLGITAQGLWGC